MKKVSKFLVILIISILLFEFILSNSCVSYATGEDDAEFAVGYKVANLITNLGGGIISILLWLPKLKATSILIGVDLSVTLLSKIGDKGGASGGTGIFITPYDIFFNKFGILDINFFEIDAGEGSIVTTIRTGVANWYYVMRLIASAILLVILIYVGIRMAIASVADEKAKYKKMLWDWCCSLALIFVIHYIAIFAIYTNNAIVSALDSSFKDINAEGTIAGLAMEALVGIGIRSLIAFLIFVGILAQTIFFFIAYFNRVLKIGFLILISPLITLTYSIDKMGDGKAQALGTWLKEFIFTILIQPFHCIVYMGFINVAFKLVGFKLDLNYINNLFNVNQLAQGFLAILCIKFVNDGEKIVKKIFGFSSDDSKTSFAGSAVATVAAVKTISNMGEKASNLVNNSKVSFAKFKEHYENDKPALDNIFGKGGTGGKEPSLSGKDIPSMPTGKTAEGKGTGSRSAVNRRTVSGASNKKKRKFKSKAANRLADRVKQRANHLSIAAIAGMAAYATGSTDAMTAIGIGHAAKKTSDALFNKTAKNLINGDVNSNEKKDEKLYEEHKEAKKSLEKALKDASSTLDNFDEIVREYEESTQMRKEASKTDKEADKLEKQIDKIPANSPDLEKQKKELERLRDKSKKLREEADKKYASAKEKDKDGKIKKSLKEGKSSEDIKKELEKDKSELAEKLSEMEDKIKKFWSQTAIFERLQNTHSNNSTKDLEKKANEIQRYITTILRKRRNIDLSQDSSGELPTEFITAEDTLAKSVTKNLTNRAQYDFLSKGDVGVSEILKKGGFEGDKELETLLSQYGAILAQNKFAENVDQSETIGFTENGYLNRVAEQLARRHSQD